MSGECISHKIAGSDLHQVYEAVKKRINDEGDLPYATADRQIDMLEQLMTFPLGRFLLLNKGIDGYWADYVNMHPKRGRVTKVNSEGNPFSEMEALILDKFPMVLASQQRHDIFHKELQKRCCEGVMIASVPSGHMEDLFTLDFSGIREYQLIAVDIDQNSIEDVARKAREKGVEDHVALCEIDAWKLNFPDKVDVITSNGLTMYEGDDDYVKELYQRFYENLKPGGTLITSYLTPPPTLTDSCEWDQTQIDPSDLMMQSILFRDIVAGNWQYYRSTELVKSQLESVGFVNIVVMYDQAKIFPTVVAKKPE